MGDVAALEPPASGMKAGQGEEAERGAGGERRGARQRSEGNTRWMAARGWRCRGRRLPVVEYLSEGNPFPALDALGGEVSGRRRGVEKKVQV